MSHIYGVDAPSLEDARSSVQRALGVELVSHDSDYRGGLYFRLGEELILQRSDDPGDPDWVNPDAGGAPYVLFVDSAEDAEAVRRKLESEPGIRRVRHDSG